MIITSHIIYSLGLDIFYSDRALDGMYYISGGKVHVKCGGAYTADEIEYIRNDMRAIQKAFDSGAFAGGFNSEEQSDAALSLARDTECDVCDELGSDSPEALTVNDARSAAFDAQYKPKARDTDHSWTELLAQVRVLGFTLRRNDDEYRLNKKGASEATAYYTNNRDDVLVTALNWNGSSAGNTGRFASQSIRH